MCGEHKALAGMGKHPMGSSPHVRGAPIHPSADHEAGRDHPRMCGEHRPILLALVLMPGSSPHVRGARRMRWGKIMESGIIPACAGSTPPMPC